MSDDKVITIGGKPVQKPVNEHVVSALESLLDRARTGEINGIAVVYDRGRDQPVTTLLETNGNHLGMGQAISSLWFRFQTRMLEQSEVYDDG